MKTKVYLVSATKFAMCHKNHSLEFCEVFQVHPVKYRPRMFSVFHINKGYSQDIIFVYVLIGNHALTVLLYLRIHHRSTNVSLSPLFIHIFLICFRLTTAVREIIIISLLEEEYRRF